MNLRLEGRVALVCGASQGIGKAIANQLADQGASVIITSRSEDKLKLVTSSLTCKFGQKHDYITCDFSDKQQVEKFIKQVSHIDNIQILINNTGGPDPAPLSSESPDNLENAYFQHVIVSHRLALAVLDSMKANRYGRIINITSIGARQPIDNLGVSNTIRSAVAGWSKTIATEVAPWGITVNNILPGYTATERMERLNQSRAAAQGKTVDEIASSVISGIPAGRFVTPQEIAFLAGFLASETSAMITGTSIPVDGGFLRCL